MESGSRVRNANYLAFSFNSAMTVTWQALLSSVKYSHFSRPSYTSRLQTMNSEYTFLLLSSCLPSLHHKRQTTFCYLPGCLFIFLTPNSGTTFLTKRPWLFERWCLPSSIFRIPWAMALEVYPITIRSVECIALFWILLFALYLFRMKSQHIPEPGETVPGDPSCSFSRPIVNCLVTVPIYSNSVNLIF